jgi:predicted lipoprotein
MITFEVLGDSNVTRNWKTVSDYYEPMRGSTSRSTTSLSALRDNLRTVSQLTEYLIMACLTNPLTNIPIDNITSTKNVCTDRLKEIFELVSKTLAANSNLKVNFVSLSLLAILALLVYFQL